MARELPREWQAVPVTNAQTIDLTKLASETIPQDIIAKGDVLAVDILVGGRKEDFVQPMKASVKEDGQIDLALIGSVPVTGLNMLEAQDAIRNAAMTRDVYRDPQVAVSMSRERKNRITVIGAVGKPGIVELRPGNSDLLQAITVAGGLTKDAGTIVEVRHPGFQAGTSPRQRSPSIADGSGSGVISASGQTTEADFSSPKTLKVDLVSIGSEGVQIPMLTDGMVISVEKRDPLPLTVDGLVRAPGQYEFPVGKNITVLDAVALSHGLSSPVADKIYVLRKRPGNGEPGRIQVSRSKAIRDPRENIMLQPGDVVEVAQTPATVFIDTLKLATFGIQGRVF